jgi:hypothetical protein
VAFVPVLTFGRRSGDRADTQPDHQHRLVSPQKNEKIAPSRRAGTDPFGHA